MYFMPSIVPKSSVKSIIGRPSKQLAQCRKILLRHCQAKNCADCDDKERSSNNPYGLINDVSVNEERHSNHESDKHSPKNASRVQSAPVQTQNCRDDNTSGNRVENP